MRSKAHQQAAKQELMEAVAAELLAQTEPAQWDRALAADHGIENKALEADAPMAA